MTTTYVNWGTSTIKLTWVESKSLPEHQYITSIHGFCFQNEKLLMIDLKDRGWDFPGGHIEEGETPVECIKRETLEEAYVKGDTTLLGYVIVDHTDNPNWDPNGKYPKIGYQVFYRMDITELLPFAAEYESLKRTFINPVEVSSYYNGWNELYQAILDSALNSRGS